MTKPSVARTGAVWLLLAAAQWACGHRSNGGEEQGFGGAAAGMEAMGGSSAGLAGSAGGQRGVPIIPNLTTGGAPVCPTLNAPQGCDDLRFSIAFEQGRVEQPTSCVQVEALQIPQFSEENRGEMYPPLVPAEEWDRSELPAGACVFRLHGVRPDCYQRGTHNALSNYPCDFSLETGITPAAYFDSRDAEEPSAEPGCPSPNWGSTAQGYWWYLNARDAVTTDLVICAPECASPFGSAHGACLHLTGGANP